MGTSHLSDERQWFWEDGAIRLPPSQNLSYCCSRFYSEGIFSSKEIEEVTPGMFGPNASTDGMV